jgi:hypothetical protein
MFVGTAGDADFLGKLFSSGKKSNLRTLEDFMSQKTAHVLVAANLNALKGFHAAVALAFQHAGPTLASKLAIRQMDTIIEEIESLAELATVSEIPAPVNGIYETSVIDTVFGADVEQRFAQLEKFCKEAKERVQEACQSMLESQKRPNSDEPLTVESLQQGTRMCYLQGIEQQAAAFTTFVEGTPGAILAQVFERLAENLRNAPPPAPQTISVLVVGDADTEHEGAHGVHCAHHGDCGRHEGGADEADGAHGADGAGATAETGEAAEAPEAECAHSAECAHHADGAHGTHEAHEAK